MSDFEKTLYSLANVLNFYLPHTYVSKGWQDYLIKATNFYAYNLVVIFLPVYARNRSYNFLKNA